jgi:predicted DNA-binding transcriptional regulator AlpA
MNDTVIQETLLSAEAVAVMLSLSKRQIFRISSQAKISAPIRIGSSVRWSDDKLRDWVEAGCPSRQVWEGVEKGKQFIQPQKEKWYQSRKMKAAIITAVITVAGWFVTPYINKIVTSLQKGNSTLILKKTTVIQPIEVITHGPNSPVSIYIASDR